MARAFASEQTAVFRNWKNYIAAQFYYRSIAMFFFFDNLFV